MNKKPPEIRIFCISGGFFCIYVVFPFIFQYGKVNKNLRKYKNSFILNNMNLHENNDFGRKVFFIMPSFDFRSLVIPALYEQEFEVYIFDSYTKAKDILRNYPDSICFINTDEGMTPGEWYFYVKSFEEDPMLATIFLGIICTRMTKAQKEQFVMDTTIPAGILEARLSHEELIENIIKILEINGAKGRRRYVRAKCSDDYASFATFLINGSDVQVNINDISSAGISCTTQAVYADFFKTNMLIRNFSITLRNKKVTCIGVVLMTNVQGDKLNFVIVFTPNIAFTTRSFIREYVHHELQNQIDVKILEVKTDTTDYAQIAQDAASKERLPELEKTS